MQVSLRSLAKVMGIEINKDRHLEAQHALSCLRSADWLDDFYFHKRLYFVHVSLPLPQLDIAVVHDIFRCFSMFFLCCHYAATTVLAL